MKIVIDFFESKEKGTGEEIFVLHGSTNHYNDKHLKLPSSQNAQNISRFGKSTMLME